MAEPAAGLISNDDCLRYVTPYIRRIVESVQDDRFLVILHNCGDTGHCTEAMVGTGAAGYHFGNQADMVAALDACPGEALVMGNLDPVGISRGHLPKRSTGRPAICSKPHAATPTTSSRRGVTFPRPFRRPTSRPSTGP